MAVSSPLGADVLVFHRMTATEELGRLFRYDLELISDDHNIEFKDVLGQRFTVHLDLGNGGSRWFDGFASQFVYGGSRGRRAVYRATLRPWFWFLTRTTDCRIFQDVSVPDIVKQVFRDFGFTDFEERFEETYRKRDYCVQYRETAFDFLSRLLEEEGIYYFFKHEDGKHTLILCDSPSAHEPVEGYEQLPFHDVAEGTVAGNEHVSSWLVAQDLQPGAYAHSDYDFVRPDANQLERQQQQREHAHGEYEVFDYPGAFVDPGEEPDGGPGADGIREARQRYAKIRLQELQAQHERVTGETDARGLTTGALFDLTDYPRDDQNRQYLVVAASYELRAEQYESGSAAAGPTFSCRFDATAGQLPYRTPRTTHKAIVQGPQTAVVVGPDGETVWCDKFGRVKVKFHWDRHNEPNDKSSCWVRVSNNWAGNTWGAQFLPDVGQEVVVDFLEGDPDRPVITGRVHNKNQMPPTFLDDDDNEAGLPENKYKSIIRDRFGNEIVFDGTPDDEHVRIWSPHHESGMELGRSVVTWTRSDEGNATYGNKHGWHLGFCSDVTVGWKLEALVGWKTALSMSSNTDINLFMDKAFRWGSKLSFTKEDEVEIVSGDYKQQVTDEIVLDSEKASYVIGGKNRNAQIRLVGPPKPGSDEGKLVLSYSDEGSARVNKTADDFKLAGIAVGSVAASVAATVTGAVAFSSNPTKDKFDGVLGGGAALLKSMSAWNIGLSVATLAFDVWMSRKIKKYSEGAPPQDTTPDSQIVLDQKGIFLEAGTVKSGPGAVMLELAKDGKVLIYGKGDMQIVTDGKLTINGKDHRVEAKLEVKGPIKNEAFEVKAKPPPLPPKPKRPRRNAVVFERSPLPSEVLEDEQQGKPKR